MLTIAIPFYQGREYLIQAIESVLRQKNPNYLLIISDDQGQDTPRLLHGSPLSPTFVCPYALASPDHLLPLAKYSTRCPFRKSCASTFWRRQRIELGHCRIMFGHFSLVIRSSTMPVPLAPPVTLGCDEQSHLASIVRAHSTPQALVFRCRLILRTAAPDRPSNLQVAQELHCNRHTVGRWRSRYLAQGLSGLQDAPRPGRPRRFSPLSASGCDGDGNP